MAEIRFFDEDENGESTRTQDMLGVDASGFDFPIEPVVDRGGFISGPATAFNPSILASQSHFAGAPRPRFHPEDWDDDAEEANIRRRERDYE